MHRSTLWIASSLFLLVLGAARAEEILLTIPQPNGGYSQYFGRSVANVGDHDGDGHDDFVVGQPGYYFNSGDTSGRAHFFSGGPLVDGRPELTAQGVWGSRLGWSVTALGDFNADGDPDFAASRPGSTTPQVELFWGGAALDAVPDLTLGNGLSDSWYGNVISGGHDLNGDGHPDLAVGAILEDVEPSRQGRVWVYFGGPEADSVADLVIDAPLSGVGFGYDLHLGQDVTGDGWADLLVLGHSPHRLQVYAGGPALDNVSDLAMSLPVLPAFSFSQVPSHLTGQVTCGDLDGDGFAEIVLGLPFLVGGGQVQVLQGGPDLDNQPEAVISGHFPDEYFGSMVDVSGDVDGDGFLDLVAGSRGPLASNLAGYVNLFPGGDLAGLTSRVIMRSADINGRFGYSAVSLGDISGDQGDDLLVGSGHPYGYAWIVNEFFYDQDDDGLPDLEQGHPDCDGDQVPDPAQIWLWPYQDCAADGFLDACQIAADPGLDCDGDGTIDSCTLATQPGLDCDGNGELDQCQLAADPGQDCDASGVLDACELADAPELDCNGDGLLDLCQLAANPGLDCDADGVFDGCQIAADYLLDRDQDDVLDYCQYPGKLSLYADPAYTTHRLQSASGGLVGPFYLVLSLPERGGDLTHVELELTFPVEVTAVQVVPALGYDADNSAEGLSLYFFPARAPDAAGNLLLAQVFVFLADPVPDSVALGIAGNSSAVGNPDFEEPVYEDHHGAVRLVTATESGFIYGPASDVPSSEPVLRLAVSNHPNPFNPSTSIQLDLPRAGAARLEILDLTGRLVRKFELTPAAPGRQSISWLGRDHQGRHVASGVYLARVSQGVQVAQTKLVLLR